MTQIAETKRLVKPQIREVVLVDGQISKINFQLDVKDDKIPLYLFGLMNEFLEAKNYVTVEPVSITKNKDSEISEAMSRLEDMEISNN